MGSSTVVSATPPLTPPLPASASDSPMPGEFATSNDITTLSRMAFIRLVMTRRELSTSSVDDIEQAHSASTRRQYESGWKNFQTFVSSSGVKTMIPSVLTSFATHVFHAKATVSPATVTNAMVAVRDPLYFGFGVTIDDREWVLLRGSLFRHRPQPSQSHHTGLSSWSWTCYNLPSTNQHHLPPTCSSEHCFWSLWLQAIECHNRRLY